MIFREANTEDIPQIQVVRNAVTENILSNPNLVTDADCREFLLERGKGWVCEINNQIVGFSIVDLKENNIWALFVDPNHDQKGIGKQLHNLMLDWYFSQTKKTVWLGTSPKTRAAIFYKKQGWTEVGWHGKDSDGSEQPKEIKFEMTFEDWSQHYF